MSIEGSTMSTEPFDKFEELGRRAVACRHWRWMSGMKLIVPSKHDGATGYTVRLQQDGYVPNPNEHPDLADPATLGCLLALVREVFNLPLYVELNPHGTPKARLCYVEGYYVGIKKLVAVEGCSGNTEAEALVAALEAAP